MKKMRTRTKLVYLSISAVIGLFIYEVCCSIFGWNQPNDAFVIGWYSFFAVELYCISNITIKGKASEGQ